MHYTRKCLLVEMIPIVVRKDDTTLYDAVWNDSMESGTCITEAICTTCELSEFLCGERCCAVEQLEFNGAYVLFFIVP